MAFFFRASTKGERRAKRSAATLCEEGEGEEALVQSRQMVAFDLGKSTVASDAAKRHAGSSTLPC